MSKKFDYIDAIRGLAIFMVIVLHTAQYGTLIPSTLLNRILSNGARGVQLFFVASAFTLFLSYNNRKQEQNETFNFFIRRFFRIAPMYYLGILFFSLVTDKATTGSVLSNIFFIHGLHPDWVAQLVPGGWSISVEMLFYCLVPLMVKKINTLNKVIYLFIGAVVFNYLFQSIFSHYSDSKTWENFLFLSFPNHFPVFAFGIAAYLLIIKKDHQVGAKPLIFLALLLTAHVILVNVFSNIVLSGVAFMVLLISLSKRQFKILVNPFFSYLGKISYSSYLVHFAVLQGLERLHFVNFLEVSNLPTGIINYSIRFALVLGSTIVIASFFYRFVELPMQKIGRNIIKLFTPSELHTQPERL
jgi:peptidoglycan/LPS O-acetylase OafA/YrhL